MVRRRREDWPLRLNAWLESIREKPFDWGVHDCVLGAADAVRMMTGVDPAAAFRGRYGTGFAASRILIEHGGFEAMASAALGAPLASPRLAGRGDLVLVEAGPEGPALAVVILADAAAPGPAGVTFVPMKDWRIAWRV